VANRGRVYDRLRAMERCGSLFFHEPVKGRPGFDPSDTKEREGFPVKRGGERQGGSILKHPSKSQKRNASFPEAGRKRGNNTSSPYSEKRGKTQVAVEKMGGWRDKAPYFLERAVRKSTRPPFGVNKKKVICTNECKNRREGESVVFLKTSTLRGGGAMVFAL